MIETEALTDDGESLSGVISEYVSSNDNWTLMAGLELLFLHKIF